MSSERFRNSIIAAGIGVGLVFAADRIATNSINYDSLIQKSPSVPVGAIPENRSLVVVPSVIKQRK